MSNYPQNQRFDKPFSRKVIKESNHGSGLVPHRPRRSGVWCGAQQVLNQILDIIFPKKCLGCKKFTGKNDYAYVCKKCFDEVEVKNTLECVGCKRETKFGLTCVSCRKDNSLDQLIIATNLSDRLIEKTLKAYKYKFITSMTLPLTIIAQRSIKKISKKNFNLFDGNPLLIPTPLHKRRLNERGFNQAELLAQNIADTYFVSYNADVLKRVSNTKHQADAKSRQERLNNVKNNFAVTNAGTVRGRTIILVDDICTTGATLNECARVLKESGVKRVIAFVIARG